MCMETFLRLPEEKRSRFLDAAWEEFTRVSFADASTNQIVRRAGIPRGSFYQYFRDKEDLFHYLMTQARDHFVELYSGIMDEVGGDMFQTQLLCYDRFAQQRPEPDVLFERCTQVLRLNPGLHMQMLLEDQPGCRTMMDISKKADLSAFDSGETAKEAFMLSLLALVAAVMDGLAGPERAAEFRNQLVKRLEIIKQGSLAAGRSQTARRNL